MYFGENLLLSAILSRFLRFDARTDSLEFLAITTKSNAKQEARQLLQRRPKLASHDERAVEGDSICFQQTLTSFVGGRGGGQASSNVSVRNYNEA
jgi:hypothetical protein